MDPFLIKRNDTLPSLVATLSDDDGPFDLTGCTVRFALRAMPKGRSAGAKFKSDAYLVDAVNGKVRYEWAPSDTDTAGAFIGEFEVTTSDGKVISFPTEEFIPVAILEDAG